MKLGGEGKNVSSAIVIGVGIGIENKTPEA